MPKLLIKTRKGVHIREKSKESAENLEVVAPTKAATWEAFGQASYNAAGGTMEDVIANVIAEMKGVAFKADKQRLPVTQEDYEGLLIQAANKGVSKARVDSLVVIVAKKEKTIEEQVEEFMRNRT
ncbi:MAG: hypothetical protein PHU34_11335 [Candidatus Methanoperedens sp.]|nr:hypothetical protein [Candidatus Methanoperedens sp.]